MTRASDLPPYNCLASIGNPTPHTYLPRYSPWPRNAVAAHLASRNPAKYSQPSHYIDHPSIYYQMQVTGQHLLTSLLDNPVSIVVSNMSYTLNKPSIQMSYISSRQLTITQPTLALLRVLPTKHSYILDVIIAKEQNLWPTWLCVPLLTTLVDRVYSAFHSIGLPRQRDKSVSTCLCQYSKSSGAIPLDSG